jgi:hypothetical protein
MQILEDKSDGLGHGKPTSTHHDVSLQVKSY